MPRPYVNFRPSSELWEAIASIGEKTGLTNADVARQLCLCGLAEFYKGKFHFDETLIVTETGRPDKRHSRVTGAKIRESRLGRMSRKGSGKDVKLGDLNMPTPPRTTSEGGNSDE